MATAVSKLMVLRDRLNFAKPSLRRSNIKNVCLRCRCRQCRCIFRDQLHLARLEDLLQQLLKCAIDRICELRVPAVEDGKKGNETSEERSDVAINEWSQPDMERLFLAVGKIFQLPFPFYQVRKIHLLRQVYNATNIHVCVSLILFYFFILGQF